MGNKKADAEGGADTKDDGTGEAPLTEGQEQPEGWDAESEHTSAVDRMFSMVDELELDPRELVFDVRDFLLDTIKARPKPWSGTSQAEQRDVAAACEHAAKELVRKVVEAVAANGTTSIRVLLTNVKLGNDMVITGKVKTFDEQEADQAVMTLHHAIGKHVMLTRASADDYAGGDRDAETDPDEPDFGFAGEGEEEGDEQE